MSLVINTNIPSMTAQRHLASSRADMEQAMERLSSGKRINSAMEDAAGLTIAHSLDTKIVSLQQAARNANDAISLIHLGEGAMDAVSSMLVRMRELATQAMNGTYSDWTDRANLDAEFSELTEEITRISNNTYFNGISVIGKTDDVAFQIGHSASDSIVLNTEKISSETIGTNTDQYVHPDAVAIGRVNVDRMYNDGTTDTSISADSEVKISFNSDVQNAAGKNIADMTQDELRAAFVLRNDTASTGTLANVSNYSVSVSNIGGGTEVTIRQTDANGDIENFSAADYDLTFTNLFDAKGDAVIRQHSGIGADATGESDSAATFTVAGAGFTGTPVKHDDVLEVSTAYLKTTDPAVAARGADGEAILHSDAYTLKEASLLELDKAKEALTVVDDALAQVDFYRVQLGAVANRLDYSVQNLYTRIENQMAARSRIEDADYAVESAALARAQVLQQAGTAMLAQANASTQNVLSLLK